MNISTLTHLDQVSNSCCIIIPLPSDSFDLSTLISEYQIAGGQAIADSFGSCEGKYGVAYQSAYPDRQILLWNVKNSSAAATCQNALEFATKNNKLISSNVVIDFRYVAKEANFLTIVKALCRALFLSDYTVGSYKTEQAKDEAPQVTSLALLCHENDEIDFVQIAQRSSAESTTIKSCMSLVNAPSNYKTPQNMADWLVSSGEKYTYNVDVLDKPQLEKLGFHALLAVNRGSEFPACCLVAQYHGRYDSDKTDIALVGKGVTFDTGGMSVKPSQNMHYMKSDMGGAAAVMGTIELAARLQLPVNLVAVIPCTDNSVDSRAIKPGDIISSYKGSSIEVIDTDAEGRLILADGLNYAIKNFNPEYIVNLATLTGSIVRTLGSHAAGMMTDNDELALQLTRAGNESGERVWRLPLWEDYQSYMASDIADIRNLSTKPVAGAITAGKFLQHFTDGHKKWAHLDIAGTAFGQSPFSKGYSATGFGILLLLSWIDNLCDQSENLCQNN